MSNEKQREPGECAKLGCGKSRDHNVHNRRWDENCNRQGRAHQFVEAEAERPILPVPPEICVTCDRPKSEHRPWSRPRKDKPLAIEADGWICPEPASSSRVRSSKGFARTSSPAVTLGKNSTSMPDLKAEWMAQDKILDYANWLQSELLKARASAPAVAGRTQGDDAAREYVTDRFEFSEGCTLIRRESLISCLADFVKGVQDGRYK